MTQHCIDHVSLGVRDLARAKAFYTPVLNTLGMKLVLELDGAIAYGVDHPTFWINLPFDNNEASVGNGTHICFRAPSRQAVDAFYAAALQYEGLDAGQPGLRPQYTPTYYAAFAFDLDGNKIEAVCHDAG